MTRYHQEQTLRLCKFKQQTTYVNNGYPYDGEINFFGS